MNEAIVVYIGKICVRQEDKMLEAFIKVKEPG